MSRWAPSLGLAVQTCPAGSTAVLAGRCGAAGQYLQPLDSVVGFRQENLRSRESMAAWPCLSSLLCNTPPNPPPNPQVQPHIQVCVGMHSLVYMHIYMCIIHQNTVQNTRIFLNTHTHCKTHANFKTHTDFRTQISECRWMHTNFRMHVAGRTQISGQDASRFQDADFRMHADRFQDARSFCVRRILSCTVAYIPSL